MTKQLVYICRITILRFLHYCVAFVPQSRLARMWSPGSRTRTETTVDCPRRIGARTRPGHSASGVSMGKTRRFSETREGGSAQTGHKATGRTATGRLDGIDGVPVPPPTRRRIGTGIGVGRCFSGYRRCG